MEQKENKDVLTVAEQTATEDAREENVGGISGANAESVSDDGKTGSLEKGNDSEAQEKSGETETAGELVVPSDTNENKEVAEGEKDEEVKDPEKERKKKVRNKILGYIGFIVINVAVILGLVLFEDRSGDMASGQVMLEKLAQNPLYIVIAFLLFFCIVAGDIVVIRTASAAMKKKRSLAVCAETSLLGRYFDRITPWAIGGEPFQIVCLKKSGLSYGESSAIVMSKHIAMFFSGALFVIPTMAISGIGIGANIYVMIAAFFSIISGLILPTFMLFCSFKPIVGEKIGKGIIAFLHKIKIVKNKEKSEKKLLSDIDQFLGGIKFLVAHKHIIIIMAVCAIIECFATQSVPYFVMRSLGINDIEFWNIFVLCLFVNYAAGFAPTPGGSGLAELSFYAIFSAHIAGGLLFWAVLLWRLAVFYVPIAVGFVIQIVQSAKDIHRVRKSAKAERI